MPVTIRQATIGFKDENGNYIRTNSLVEQTVEAQVGSIQQQGAAQVTAVQNAGSAQVAAVQQEGSTQVSAVQTAAEDATDDIQDLVDAVDVATMPEFLAYLDTDGSVEPSDEVPVSGANPTIVAQKNTYYVCGELQSLTFTPNTSGLCAVRFTSGTTPTVLSVTNTVKWPDWFSGTLEANRIYEISIMDGIYGAVMSWA